MGVVVIIIIVVVVSVAAGAVDAHKRLGRICQYMVIHLPNPDCRDQSFLAF